MEVVYDELRRLANLQMRAERRDHTLQPTAVVHEAFARLVDLKLDWQDRAHFLSMSARLMRRVLIDHARGRRAAKRGEGALRVSLHERHAVVEPSYDLLSLDAALERLRKHKKRPGRALELHYFGGLTYREIAEVLGVSEATVDRDMRLARLWIAKEIKAEERTLPSP